MVSTYARNFGNSLRTSLNFNNALAYESSVGDSTKSFQALMILSTTSQCLSFFTSFTSFSTTFASLGFALTVQSVMHLAFTFFPIWKITKYNVYFRENFGNNIHQSTVPIGDNPLRHVEFWEQKTNQHLWWWEKHKKGGLNCVSFFSSFSLKLKHIDQKQFKNSFWSDIQN